MDAYAFGLTLVATLTGRPAEQPIDGRPGERHEDPQLLYRSYCVSGNEFALDVACCDGAGV